MPIPTPRTQPTVYAVIGNDPTTRRYLAVELEHVVHPVLLGGWWCQGPSPKEKPDEAAR